MYSFSQPNDWVYEPVRERMTYWNDPYHFSLEMGRAMQHALAGVPRADLPQDFMVRLTSEAVRPHIAERRAAVLQWASRNAEFSARFEEQRRKWEASRAPAPGAAPGPR